MRCFGLTPEDMLTRATAADTRPSLSLGSSMLQGALSVAAVSVLAYSIWAFQLIAATAAMYASIAAIYLGLAGVALGRLVLGPGAGARFALLFATAFAVYAIIWCACWFGLGGKHHADLWGAALGLAAMTRLIQAAFGRRENFLPLFAVLFTTHTLGYTLGGEFHATVPGSAGRLLWGGAHGLGFGAGLGYVLYHCQSRHRALLGVK